MCAVVKVLRVRSGVVAFCAPFPVQRLPPCAVPRPPLFSWCSRFGASGLYGFCSSALVSFTVYHRPRSLRRLPAVVPVRLQLAAESRSPAIYGRFLLLWRFVQIGEQRCSLVRVKRT